MKILGINSSPRGSKSSTLRLVKAVLDGAASEGADVELVDLCKLNIKYCNACGICYAKGECVHEDDFAELYEKILRYDGFVLGSPNYFRNVTAQMKTMIDRMVDAVHCQLLLGKYGCTVATAGSPTSAEVTDYLSNIIIGFGAASVGAVGASPLIPGSMEDAEKRAFDMGTDLVKSILTKRVYPEQEPLHAERLARFRMLVTRNKDIWSHEYEYFVKKGWI